MPEYLLYFSAIFTTYIVLSAVTKAVTRVETDTPFVRYISKMTAEEMEDKILQIYGKIYIKQQHTKLYSVKLVYENQQDNTPKYEYTLHGLGAFFLILIISVLFHFIRLHGAGSGIFGMKEIMYSLLLCMWVFVTNTICSILYDRFENGSKKFSKLQDDKD